MWLASLSPSLPRESTIIDIFEESSESELSSFSLSHFHSKSALENGKTFLPPLPNRILLVTREECTLRFSSPLISLHPKVPLPFLLLLCCSKSFSSRAQTSFLCESFLQRRTISLDAPFSTDLRSFPQRREDAFGANNGLPSLAPLLCVYTGYIV